MAEQLQQERRGGAHARPGPPARSRPKPPDGVPAVPLHRAPSSGRHTGTRTRADGSRAPRTLGLLVGAAAVTAGAAFWLQDLREPDRTTPQARPAATSLPDTGAGVDTSVDDQSGTGTGTVPSLDPVPSAVPSTAPSVDGGVGPSTDPSAGASLDPGTGLTPGAGAPAAGDSGTGALAIPDRTALVQAATSPTRDPAAVRAALEQVLSARGTATAALLRAVVGGDLDAAVPAASAVDSTSADLEAVVGALRDPATATSLRTAFDAQTVASRSYATAVRADDEPAADAARAEMGVTSRTLGQLLEQLTGGGITSFVPPENAARLRDLVDAQAVGDTASADDVGAWLTARMGREGVALATALAGPA